jgi:hypothetical protein
MQINVTDTLIPALINERNSAIFRTPKHCLQHYNFNFMGKLPDPFLPFVFSTFFTLTIPSAMDYLSTSPASMLAIKAFHTSRTHIPQMELFSSPKI